MRIYKILNLNELPNRNQTKSPIIADVPHLKKKTTCLILKHNIIVKE